MLAGVIMVDDRVCQPAGGADARDRFIAATVAGGKGPLGVKVPEAVGALAALALVIGVSIAAVRGERRRVGVDSLRGPLRHG
ncbi:MAG: hypothetical protein ACXVHB_19400 [Solirubrobacteraceae bacterium]